MNTIKITVSGKEKSGKTTVLIDIQKALALIGYKTSVILDNFQLSKNEFYLKRNLNECRDFVRKNTQIKLQEIGENNDLDNDGFITIKVKPGAYVMYPESSTTNIGVNTVPVCLGKGERLVHLTPEERKIICDNLEQCSMFENIDNIENKKLFSDSIRQDIFDKLK